MMHNYTLQLLAIISDEIKNNPQIDNEMKNNLVRYSVGLVYRISQFVQSQSKKIVEKMTDINNLLMLNTKLNKVVESKVDELITTLKSKQIGGKKIVPVVQEPAQEEEDSVSSEEDMNEIYDL